MKVIDPGHVYELTSIDEKPHWWPWWLWPWRIETLQFVKREGPGYPGNIGHHPGTNLQETFRVQIDRVKYLNNQLPHMANYTVIQYLRSCIVELEIRAAERHNRKTPIFTSTPELMPVCSKCGHIGCEETCL